jgi:hypothetical protein
MMEAFVKKLLSVREDELGLDHSTAWTVTTP